MGIDLASSCLLAETLRDLPDKDRKRVLTLANQSCFFTYQDVTRVLRRRGIPFQEIPPGEVKLTSTFDPAAAGKQYVDQRTFFQLLGFDERNVHAMDVNDYEKADVLHDLNTPIPDALAASQDLIYDGGTLEYVFSVKDVLSNVRAMLRVGGMVIHAEPVEISIRHRGFYTFSDAVFRDFYSANGFQEVVCKYFSLAPYRHRDRFYMEFDPVDFTVSLGPFFSTYCFAAFRKVKEVPFQIPQCGYFVNAWKEGISRSLPRRQGLWRRFLIRGVFATRMGANLLLGMRQMRKAKRVRLL